ncbi:MAG: hypothetical protein ACKVPX_11305 [Myxococcaceae bacterium]
MRLRSWLAWLFLAIVGGAPGRADAYVWMIRHGQTGCASCHFDPSGGGILTTYGRAQSLLLLPPSAGELSEGEIDQKKGFFFGLVKLADWVNLGFSARIGGLLNKAGSGDVAIRPVQMVTDLRMAFEKGPFQASASVGYAIRGALPAALSGGETNNIVSREHWVGLASEDESFRVRVGRMTLPFGLRVAEHTLWVRRATRTDLNEQQQHGVAVNYTGEVLRGEVMAILGNYQLRPDTFRERGVSGFVEWAPLPTLAIGASTLLTHAFYDIDTRRASTLRQAHGVFGRWAPIEPLAVLVEADLLVSSALVSGVQWGGTGVGQVDWEIIQGVHAIGTLEFLHQSGRFQAGGWASVAYFCLPQLEFRLDAILRNVETSGERLNVFTLVGQVHLSL